ncbi:MAG: protein-export chaperone SecB [Clostridia bacterium]|nr:protein-export chaperone SecB [Clostridia bacterium]
MSIVRMKGYTVKSLSFNTSLPSGKQITLQNACSYNVRYSKEGLCVGSLECKVSDKDAPDSFYVNIHIEGVFHFDASLPREQIHVATYKELFPYARSVVTSVTALCGITPIMIPQIDIEGQDIYRIDTEGLKP